MERKRDANVAARSQAVVQVAAFHDSGPKQLLLTAGFDQTLRLFDLDGEANELVASVRFLDMPVKSAVFSGDDVFCSGRRNWLYVFDLESQSVSKVLCGKGGLQRREKSFERIVASPEHGTSHKMRSKKMCSTVPS